MRKIILALAVILMGGATLSTANAAPALSNISQAVAEVQQDTKIQNVHWYKKHYNHYYYKNHYYKNYHYKPYYYKHYYKKHYYKPYYYKHYYKKHYYNYDY